MIVVDLRQMFSPISSNKALKKVLNLYPIITDFCFRGCARSRGKLPGYPHVIVWAVNLNKLPRSRTIIQRSSWLGFQLQTMESTSGVFLWDVNWKRCYSCFTGVHALHNSQFEWGAKVFFGAFLKHDDGIVSLEYKVNFLEDISKICFYHIHQL